MKEKASEISNLVAAELDHYRRSYVDHGRLEIEEAAKEAIDRGRSKLNETVEIASATITDRVQHVMPTRCAASSMPPARPSKNRRPK